MKIVFFPLEQENSNSYISRICQSIHLIDPFIKILPFSRKFISPKFKVDIYWFNWFENLGKDGKISVIKNLIIKVVYIYIIKFYKKKVIITLHNKRTHESKYRKISLWFLRFLLSKSDAIVILCEESYSVIKEITQKDYSKKIFKILHPTYVCTSRKYIFPPDKSFTILFIGMIRPYKNIELLIDIAEKHPELNFIIAGKPIDNLYQKKLEVRTNKLSNIKTIFKFLSDSEFDTLMESATLIVLPYHLESTLNSGVAMYAFSKGLNVIIPNIGTISELTNHDLVFSYSCDIEDHDGQIIEKKIMEAYNLYKSDYSQFVNRALTIRNEVLERCSIECISNQIKSMFDYLTN